MSSSHLRNSSSISSSAFDLKSANSSDDEFTRFVQAEVKRLKAIPKPIYQIITEKFGQEITLENHVLKCPIGANYFYAFLQGEFNAENLEAYYEAKAVQDFLLVFVEKRKELLGVEIIEKEVKGESIDLEELRPKFVQNGTILFQYAADSIEKGQKFVSDYIVTGAPKQVNLPSKIKTSLEESFHAIFDMYSKFAEKYKQMADAEPSEKAQKCDFLLVVTQLQSALETTMKELMVNLYDPYSRFTNSDYFYEIAAVIGSEEAKASYEKLKEKIITATLAQGAALNEQFPTTGLTARHPVTVAYERLSEMLSFIEKNKSSMFNTADSTLFDINYDFLQNKESCKWTTIVEHSSEFIKVDLNTLRTEEDKIAFFTNVYNFMLIHAAVVSNGLPRTTANRTNFFGKTRYNLGGHLFSLYDIHQGILRGNAKHWFYGKPFGKNDPRVQYIIKLPLPNQCFALVDLTQHSPVARPIQNNNVAEQFNQLTAEYVKRYVRFEEKSVKIPAYMKEHSSEYVTSTCKIASVIHPLQPIVEYLKINNLGVTKESWDKVLETKKPVVVNPDRFDSFACLLEQEQLPQEYCEKYDKVCCKKKQEVAGAVEKQVQQEQTPQLIKNSKKWSFSLFKRFGKKPKKIVKQEKTCKVM